MQKIYNTYLALILTLCALCLALPISGCLADQESRRRIGDATENIRGLLSKISELERKLEADIRGGAISPETISAVIKEIGTMKTDALALVNEIRDIKENGVTWNDLIWGIIGSFVFGNGSAFGAGLVKTRLKTALDNAASKAANGD